MNTTTHTTLIKDLVMNTLIEAGLTRSQYLGEIDSIDNYINESKPLPVFFHYYIKTNDTEELTFSMNSLIIREMIQVSSEPLEIQLNEVGINTIIDDIYKQHMAVVSEELNLIGA